MARVLIMEDEPSIALVLKIALTEEGNEVVTAANGIEGLARLRQGPAPEIVFVDLKMPGMGGRAVCEKMHADPGLKDIPVVILSGSLPDRNLLPPRCTYRLLLPKPFDLVEIINTVNAAVDNRLVASL